MRKGQYQTGLSGEELAEKYLIEKGMVPLCRRYRFGRGEIDLIMMDGDMIVMVEVKYRPTAAPGEGLKAITSDKQRRMAQAAMGYIAEHRLWNRQVRFDALEITAGGICHIPNAFTL